MQRDALLLAEMIEAGERIIALAARLDSTAADVDRDLVDALLWNFTVLGEASNQVSSDLKEANPHVPWSDPVGVRNRIGHGYWSVEPDVLLTAAREDVPGWSLRSEPSRPPDR